MKIIEVKSESYNPNDDRSLVGKVGDTIRTVKRSTRLAPLNCNAHVAHYEWTEKRVTSRKKPDYLAGGWYDLGSNKVGLWLMTYCGAEMVP